MVVFVDFGEESDSDDSHDSAIAGVVSRHLPRHVASRDRNKAPMMAGSKLIAGGLQDDTADQNAQLFGQALSCYPITSSITSHLDLNTLHALSLTCSLFRRTLLPFRPQLATQTLRCFNDIDPSRSRFSSSAVGDPSSPPPLRVQGRLAWDNMIRTGPCARDMVGGCRRCGTVVCRNCTAKPLSGRFIKDRVRRLCTACLAVPIQWHMSSTGGAALASPHSLNQEFFTTFTSPAFTHDPCTCEETVWLCHSCGGSLHSADVTYKRVWTWRSRYSTHIGGLGTGMGEGDQGQKCGKGENCADATEIEVEIDCSAELGTSPVEGPDGKAVSTGIGGMMGRTSGDRRRVEGNEAGWEEPKGREKLEIFKSWIDKNDRPIEGPGYYHQEIEGIGGVVKKKVKKRVRVGATVQEFEDERETGRYLDREEKGLLRCWCGWCDHVVPCKEELDEMEDGA